MSTALLATKFYLPPPRSHAVVRAHMIARLNAGRHRRLTLIVAPAGFGKTTLVSAWLTDLRFTIDDLRLQDAKNEIVNRQSKIVNLQVAWLSLDASDSDPTRFLTYLVAALQTVVPALGAGALAMLQSAQPPPHEALLTSLLNEIATAPHKLILVLDDYHLIDAPLVDQALAFLLERMPPQLHLVIISREDPQLPLARYRARDQLTELRAADLRFTPDEAATFFRQVMDLDLAADDVAVLEERTEGWIAGLQLAALSLRGRTDAGQFVRAFAGDNRYIMDYLVAEVLQRQPVGVRRFLLQTAILDRLSGPLCDAVRIEHAELSMGNSEQQQSSPFAILNSQLMLEELERANLFLVPLDDTRRWYRYHHLFAEVLMAQLRAKQPELVATLHQRASGWYAQQGLWADAIGHALAAEDFARTADLIELATPAMRQGRQETTLLGWLKALPAELFDARPVLSVGAVGALLAVGDLSGVDEHLRAAERWLATSVTARVGMVVVDEAAFQRLPGAIAVYRAALALALGKLADAIAYARRAIELVPADEHLLHGGAVGLLGIAAWASGDLDTAHQTFAAGMASLQKAAHLADVLGLAIALADIRIAQGRLREARQAYEQGLRLATAQDAPLRGAVDMYVGMSELAREQNDLHAAMQYLLRGQELGEHLGLPQSAYRWRVAMAQLKVAQGDLTGALGLLDEAERRYVGDFFPNVRPIAALRARVWLAQGRLGVALGWAQAQRLAADDALSYLREFEHVTLARVLLAQHASEGQAGALRAALQLLARLLRAAEAGARMGSVIELLALQALAHQAQGDLPAALVPLGRALALAAPAGYARLFVGEGAAMAALLRAAARQRVASGYVDQLLAACATAERRPAAQGGLAEPLSEREREVLRLLGSELSGPEIARALVVSLSTLRTHTRNIYAKLGVGSRRAAVRRAQELDLL